MRGIKIPQYEFALKMQGGRICRTLRYIIDTPYTSLPPSTCHESKSRITSHLHHIATSDNVLSTDGEPGLSQESKTKVFITS